MPGEFQVLLGDLLQRTPEKCIWAGQHDPARVLRVPAEDIACGLAKGRAELPLARLIALAPDVFRWEPGDSNAPRIRLPLQKLLQQIGGHLPASAPTATPVAASVWSFPVHRGNFEAVAPGPARESRPVAVESGVVGAHLLSVDLAAADRAAAPPPEAVAVATSAPVQPVPVETPASAMTPGIPSMLHAQPPPESGVILAPAVPREVRNPEADAPAEQVLKPVELRPQTDVPMSMTLRAVILGGGEAPPGSPILAPHSPPSSSPPIPVFLAPAAARSPIAPAPAPAQSEPRIDSAHASTGATDFSSLQSLFMTDEPLDLGGVAVRVASLPGVNACLITGARGTARAGQFPAGLDAGVLGALAVELSSKVVESATRLHVGRVESTTVHRDDCAIAIFSHEGACLSVVLGPRGFVAGVRQLLARATEFLGGARANS